MQQLVMLQRSCNSCFLAVPASNCSSDCFVGSDSAPLLSESDNVIFGSGLWTGSCQVISMQFNYFNKPTQKNWDPVYTQKKG